MNEIAWIDVLGKETIISRRKPGTLQLVSRKYANSKLLTSVLVDMVLSGVVSAHQYHIAPGCYTVLAEGRKSKRKR